MVLTRGNRKTSAFELNEQFICTLRSREGNKSRLDLDVNPTPPGLSGHLVSLCFCYSMLHIQDRIFNNSEGWIALYSPVLLKKLMSADFHNVHDQIVFPELDSCTLLLKMPL